MSFKDYPPVIHASVILFGACVAVWALSVPSVAPIHTVLKATICLGGGSLVGGGFIGLFSK